MGREYGESEYQERRNELEEEEFYRNILGLKESYAEDLGLDYSERELDSIKIEKDKLEGSKKRLEKSIKNCLITGTSSVLGYFSIKTGLEFDIGMESIFVITGMGLLGYGLMVGTKNIVENYLERKYGNNF